MASIERTAYPRLNKWMSDEELRVRYELSNAERRFVSINVNGDRQRLTPAALRRDRLYQALQVRFGRILEESLPSPRLRLGRIGRLLQESEHSADGSAVLPSGKERKREETNDDD